MDLVWLADSQSVSHSRTDKSQIHQFHGNHLMAVYGGKGPLGNEMLLVIVGIEDAVFTWEEEHLVAQWSFPSKRALTLWGGEVCNSLQMPLKEHAFGRDMVGG